jgi:iron only hydrogenase large subunit-like protein
MRERTRERKRGERKIERKKKGETKERVERDCVCVRACVGGGERERKQARERKRGRERQTARGIEGAEGERDVDMLPFLSSFNKID